MAPHKSTLILKKTNSGIRWSAAIININAGREIALLDLAEASFRPGGSSHGATIDPVIGISRSSNERLGRMEGRKEGLLLSLSFAGLRGLISSSTLSSTSLWTEAVRSGGGNT